MSPRKNRHQPSGPPTGDQVRGVDYVESDGDGDWVVRPVAAANATKPYRCPGCDQEIAVGVPHVVAWSADWLGGDDRRHWHTACWRARGRRTPRMQRSRGGARY